MKHILDVVIVNNKSANALDWYLFDRLNEVTSLV